MKVGFIGLGKLGLPVAELMAEVHEVIGFDTVPKTKSNFAIASELKRAVEHRDLVFVAIETSHDSLYGGETPVSHLPAKDFNYVNVRNLLGKIDDLADQGQLIILISTVLPGTTREHLSHKVTRGRLIYNPYLIAMSSVKYDFVNPEMVIIGTEDGSSTSDTKKLIEFYETMMKSQVRYEIGTWDEAEAIKIFYNTFISAKIALVNMIQDLAECNGHMNVDIVTEAIAKSTQRIMGPAYMKAGMGDGGPCHPRDNIALSWLAQKLNLGYDIFGAITHSREQQAKRLAQKLLSIDNNIVILGKAYKPGVSLTSGSYSLLVAHYVEEYGGTVYFYDPNTGDLHIPQLESCVYLIGYWEAWVNNYAFQENATVLDPWRRLRNNSVRVIHYGNTRLRGSDKVSSSSKELGFSKESGSARVHKTKKSSLGETSLR